jgi:tetratricopeptide (TPR) repeat protein
MEPAGKSAPIISADLLRHPISSKTRRMLQSAVAWMRSQDHQKAIQQLQATIAKDPLSAPYVHSLLGYEFLCVGQYPAAVDSFTQAVALLPHDSSNHHNFAVSLAVVGDYERAEEEARRARELEPDNAETQRLLEALQAAAKSRHIAVSAQQ